MATINPQQPAKPKAEKKYSWLSFYWPFMFDKDEKDQLGDLCEEHKKETKTWKVVNVLFPLVIIFFTLIMVVYKAYMQDKGFLSEDLYNAILNGSLPLTAINIVILGLLSLINFNKHKEKGYGLKMDNLRTKLIVCILIVIALGWMLYGTQTVLAPFKKTDNLFLIISEIIGSILLLIYAVYLTKNVVVLQEDFIDKTFAEIGIYNEKSIPEKTPKSTLLLKRN